MLSEANLFHSPRYFEQISPARAGILSVSLDRQSFRINKIYQAGVEEREKSTATRWNKICIESEGEGTIQTIPLLPQATLLTSLCCLHFVLLIFAAYPDWAEANYWPHAPAEARCEALSDVSPRSPGSPLSALISWTWENDPWQCWLIITNNGPHVTVSQPGISTDLFWQGWHGNCFVFNIFYRV